MHKDMPYLVQANINKLFNVIKRCKLINMMSNIVHVFIILN